MPLKYQRPTTLGCNEVGIRKLGFVNIAHLLRENLFEFKNDLDN